MSYIFWSLISFWKAPWYCLVYCVQAIITATRGLLKLSLLSEKLYIVDYYLLLLYSQYRYGKLSKLFLFLFSWDWTTKRYILCYFPLTHNYYIILDMFYIKLSWKLFPFKNIESVVSWILYVTTVLKQSKNPINPDYEKQNNSKNTKFLLSQHSDHWKTEQYRGSEDRGEVNIDSDINWLDSVNLRKSTSVPVSVSYWHGHECGLFCSLIVDIILKSAQVLFSLLLARNSQYNKEPVIVYNIKNLTINGGLFCIIFLQSIPLGWVINIDFISIYVFSEKWT